MQCDVNRQSAAFLGGEVPRSMPVQGMSDVMSHKRQKLELQVYAYLCKLAALHMPAAAASQAFLSCVCCMASCDTRAIYRYLWKLLAQLLLACCSPLSELNGCILLLTLRPIVVHLQSVVCSPVHLENPAHRHKCNQSWGRLATP